MLGKQGDFKAGLEQRVVGIHTAAARPNDLASPRYGVFASR